MRSLRKLADTRHSILSPHPQMVRAHSFDSRCYARYFAGLWLTNRRLHFTQARQQYEQKEGQCTSCCTRQLLLYRALELSHHTLPAVTTSIQRCNVLLNADSPSIPLLSPPTPIRHPPSPLLTSPASFIQPHHQSSHVPRYLSAVTPIDRALPMSG